jgi:hypothetical protein
MLVCFAPSPQRATTRVATALPPITDVRAPTTMCSSVIGGHLCYRHQCEPGSPGAVSHRAQPMCPRGDRVRLGSLKHPWEHPQFAVSGSSAPLVDRRYGNPERAKSVASFGCVRARPQSEAHGRRKRSVRRRRHDMASGDGRPIPLEPVASPLPPLECGSRHANHGR